MSENATDDRSSGSGFGWRHRLAVLAVAVVVIAVVVIVFLVVKDADEPSSGDQKDQSAVESVYNRFANAVQASKPDEAGICADRSEPRDKLSQTASKLGGIGTAGSTIRVNIESVTVTGDVAQVDGSLNTMGTNVSMPLELRKVDDAWCVWS